MGSDLKIAQIVLLAHPEDAAVALWVSRHPGATRLQAEEAGVSWRRLKRMAREGALVFEDGGSYWPRNARK